MTGSHVPSTAAALAALMLLAACARGGSNAADSAGQAAFTDTAVAVAGSDTVPTPAPVDTTLAPPEKTDARPEPSRGDGRPAATPPAAQADTLRGIVAEVGSVPMTSIVVRPAGGRAVTVTGDLAREIGRAAGAEVWVRGTRTERGIEATRYAIRSVDGQPAVDGTLARDGDRLVLVNDSGRHPIARPPAALRDRVGARVFLVGSLDGAITSYGILREGR